MVDNSPKILIVFFSRTGTTGKLAESIARATHGDLESLREAKSRRGPIGWLRSGYEGTYQRSVPTLPLQHEGSLLDVTFDPGFWSNSCIAAYYKLHTIHTPVGY